jgi:signal transduction histidine kinase
LAAVLEVSVADDGRGLDGPLGQGVGLRNLRERLLALYGSRARLLLESGESGGTVARLELPL